MEIEADYYFAAGDMVSWLRGLDDIGKALSRRGEKVYVLPGNHETEEAISRMCQRYKLKTFHGETFEAGGYHFAGLGYSTPTPFNTPGEYSEQEMAKRLEPFSVLNPLVLICHCPPLGTNLDRIRPGLHSGSQSVRNFIEKHQPAFFFCGHIHEAQGVSERFGDTHALNVGKKGYLLDFDKMAL